MSTPHRIKATCAGQEQVALDDDVSDTLVGLVVLRADGDAPVMAALAAHQVVGDDHPLGEPAHADGAAAEKGSVQLEQVSAGGRVRKLVVAVHAAVAPEHAHHVLAGRAVPQAIAEERHVVPGNADEDVAVASLKPLKIAVLDRQVVDDVVVGEAFPDVKFDDRDRRPHVMSETRAADSQKQKVPRLAARVE
jgi:hypothetical protein